MALVTLPDLFASQRLRPDPAPLHIDRGRRWAHEQGWENIPADLAYKIGVDLEWHADARAAHYKPQDPGPELRAMLEARLGPSRKPAEPLASEPVEEPDAEPVTVKTVRRVRDSLRQKTDKLDARLPEGMRDEIAAFAKARGLTLSAAAVQLMEQTLQYERAIAKQARREHPRPK